MPRQLQPSGAGIEFSRRTFLKGSAAASVALAGGALWTTAIHPRRVHAVETPIRHVIVACQENRSFDHYYGFAPFVGRHGVPHGYTQPDGADGTVAPFHFTNLTTNDIRHFWSAVHAEWNDGRMDGFYTADGIDCMGYYTGEDLPFYYGLHRDFTLCVSYFCSVLGPSYPNHLYLAAATSGGVTTNDVGALGLLDYPCILDLLDAVGASWQVYNGDQDPNVFQFFARFGQDRRARATMADWRREIRRHGVALAPLVGSRWWAREFKRVPKLVSVASSCVIGARGVGDWHRSPPSHAQGDDYVHRQRQRRRHEWRGWHD